MAHSWILYVAYALSVFRGTRLVVDDKITQFIRDWLKEHGFKLMQRTDYMGSVVEQDLFTLPGFGRVWAWLFTLSSCQWCTSIWVGAVVTLLAKFQGSWFQFVAYAASFSTISGFLAAIEKRI